MSLLDVRTILNAYKNPVAKGTKLLFLNLALHIFLLDIKTFKLLVTDFFFKF